MRGPEIRHFIFYDFEEPNSNQSPPFPKRWTSELGMVTKTLFEFSMRNRNLNKARSIFELP